jgi:hypothetical protein
MKKDTYLIKVILLVIVFISLGLTQDYQFQQYQPGDRPAQYILGTDDVLLISVNLWGHIQRPGIYNVPSSFNIIDLLSSAGGPLETARLNDVRVIRKNQEVLQINVKEFITTGNKDLLVALQPGDLIIVSGSIADAFERVVRVARDIAIILNIFLLYEALKD